MDTVKSKSERTLVAKKGCPNCYGRGIVVRFIGHPPFVADGRGGYVNAERAGVWCGCVRKIEVAS